MSKYDVIIAGAGFSGILVAIRLKKIKPELSILLLEKEGSLGGRIRSSYKDRVYSCGLNLVDNELFSFFKESISERINLEEDDISYLSDIGVLAAGDLKTFSFDSLFKDEGIKTIGGMAALRDWNKKKDVLFQKYENLKKENKEVKPLFSKIYPGSSKDPSSVVIDIISSYLGIPNVWGSIFECFMQRLQDSTSKKVLIHWSDLFKKIEEIYEKDLDIVKDNLIVSATKKEDLWELKTSKGVYSCSSLIVAQSPWSALNWLDQSYYPTELLSIALKTKPVSIVSLTDFISEGSDISQLSSCTLIPSEKVQLINTSNESLSYQLCLDYEVFLDAPTVTKAVKRLKRAKKKFMSFYPNLKVEGDFISLIPAGITQIISQQDRKMPDISTYNSKDLSFCGDSYGESFCPDKNCISSIENVCNLFLE